MIIPDNCPYDLGYKFYLGAQVCHDCCLGRGTIKCYRDSDRTLAELPESLKGPKIKYIPGYFLNQQVILEEISNKEG